jgi:hypothetical protein
MATKPKKDDKAEGKEVAVLEKAGAVSTAIPDFLKGTAGRGAEALTAAALSPPRLKMAQALSPELEEIEGLKAGHFFNSSTGMVYGPVVRIIPCYASEAYYLYAPRVPGVASTGGLLARSDNGDVWDPPNASFEVTIDKKGTKVIWKTSPKVSESGLAQWGTSDPADSKSPPAATHAINMVCMMVDHMDEGPAVASFSRSALKAAKKWCGTLKMSPVATFGRVFELSSVKVDGPSGPYYEPRFKAAGFVQDPTTFAEAEGVYNSVRTRGLRVNVDTDRVDEDHTGAGNGAGGQRRHSGGAEETAAY